MRMETTQTLDERHPAGVWLWVKLIVAGIAWAVAYRLLEPASEAVAYRVLGLDPTSRLGSAVGFFLADVPKILLLLTLIVFVVGIVRSFFTPDRARAAL